MAAYRQLPRVTSDCLPFRAGGRLYLCETCGAAQSPADAQWFGEIGEIYRDYAAFHQAGGAEQCVFDAATGTLRRRSDVLADHLAVTPGFPRGGKMVDIGCGSGVTLRVFSERGGWQLHGLDQDQRSLPVLAQLPGFAALHTGTPAELPEGFDLITMVHSLEHFPEPAAVLCDLRKKLGRSKLAKDAGRLFIQVPNAEANPFEYLVADHMIHFSASVLSLLAAGAGFETPGAHEDPASPALLSKNWVAKELSFLTKPALTEPASIKPASIKPTTIQAAPLPSQNGRSASHGAVCKVRAQIDWLGQFSHTAQQASAKAPFGLFGSSIAATWLAGILGDRVSFFVEEDAKRIGREHLGRPILAVEQVPAGAQVFIALVPAIAAQIAQRVGPRLAARGATMVVPPTVVPPTEILV